MYEAPKFESKYLYRHKDIAAIATSVGESLINNGRFVDNSQLVSLDEMLCYIPDVHRWSIVKEVNIKFWYRDDFFANELFNGLNPYSVHLVKTPNELRCEFFQI